LKEKTIELNPSLMNTIFKNLKVIELANVLAGPATGMFFAELGASVVKIENKTTGGDLTRKWKVKEEEPGASVSAYYASVNWGKEVRMLDLTQAPEREEVYQLIAEADIVITNFREGENSRLGMTYEHFRRLNKRIIHGHINAYESGDKRAGFDLVLQAEAGFMYMNGSVESGPLKMPVALIDILASHQLKEGLLLALLRRNETGEGMFVSVSLYEAAIASLANQAANYLNTGSIPGQSGSLHPNIAPYGETIVSRDKKQIVLAIGTDKQFASLCRILNLPDLADNPRFASNSSRIRNRLELSLLLSEASKELDVADLLQQFEDGMVPAGMISTMEEVFSKPAAQAMVLNEIREKVEWKCVSTLAFKGLPSF
jgi:crotonobetainyl-CoA:carnitine CoA-transferase CaiB-like acyl-CoA transferase